VRAASVPLTRNTIFLDYAQRIGLH
jgi:hypothetical protein